LIRLFLSNAAHIGIKLTEALIMSLHA